MRFLVLTREAVDVNTISGKFQDFFPRFSPEKINQRTKD
jgi:hypothetical protein